MSRPAVGDTVKILTGYYANTTGTVKRVIEPDIYTVELAEASVIIDYYGRNDLELISTAPRKETEANMHSFNKVPFSLAISWLQGGLKMRRDTWPDGVYVKQITFNGFVPCLVTYCTDSEEAGPETKFPGCTLEWDDITANDWVIVE